MDFLNPTTIEFSLTTDEALKVIPGQYAQVVLRDRDGEFSRCYSVVRSEGKNLTFCVRVGEIHGRGGNVLKKMKVGDTVAVASISGQFVLAPTDNDKVFIATGTGLSPIIHMIRSIPHVPKRLYFGLRTKDEAFYLEELATIPNLTVKTYLSREKVPSFEYGRIDLSSETFDPNTEFYVCGNPGMTETIIAELRKCGFDSIYFEKF